MYLYSSFANIKYKWHKTKIMNCENVFEYNMNYIKPCKNVT